MDISGCARPARGVLAPLCRGPVRVVVDGNEIPLQPKRSRRRRRTAKTGALIRR